MPQSLLEMAKDLVMAQIKAHRLNAEDMHRELQRTYASLVELKAKEAIGSIVSMPLAEQAGAQIHDQVINWKKSITKHTVTCLECDTSFKQLSVRHLKEHGLDARSYRAKYGIPRTQPLSAKDTTAVRKQIVQKSRPWENAPTFKKAQERKSETVAEVTPTEPVAKASKATSRKNRAKK